MSMSVDEPREQHLTLGVNDSIRLHSCGHGTFIHRGDGFSVDDDIPVLDAGHVRVHRADVRVLNDEIVMSHNVSFPCDLL